MLRLRCFHRLRPCWTAFLSILRRFSSQHHAECVTIFSIYTERIRSLLGYGSYVLASGRGENYRRSRGPSPWGLSRWSCAGPSVSYARVARGLGRRGRVASRPSCSRNAPGFVCLVGWSFWSIWFFWMNFRSGQPDRRDRPDGPAFVGRAQWETNQATLLRR